MKVRCRVCQKLLGTLEPNGDFMINTKNNAKVKVRGLVNNLHFIECDCKYENIIYTKKVVLTKKIIKL